MSLEERLACIKAETAAALARAAASERRTLELKAQSSEMEAEIRRQLASPNFPEETKQHIWARLREIRGGL